MIKLTNGIEAKKFITKEVVLLILIIVLCLLMI